VSAQPPRTRRPRHLKLRTVMVGATAIGAAAVSLITASRPQEPPSAPVRTMTMRLLAYPHPEPAVRPVNASDGDVSAAGGHKPGWTPSASDALRLAVAQVGVTENANGGGTIYQKWFVASPWAVRGVERDGGSVSDYANASWCDMFISWIGDQLGVKGMGADAFTPKHAQWFKDRGRWGQTPTPGAIVFFSWSDGKTIDDIDHVGMVIKDNHDGTVQTVEGNTDDAVKIRTRDVSNVVGYGYPDYAPASR
jgi:hypothetical protein